MNGADPEGTINRREFESAIDRLSESIGELREELKKRAPGLGNMLTLAAMAVTVIVTTVQNFARVSALETWAEQHSQFSESKAAEFGQAIGDLRISARANREHINEQEMQHRWIADVINLQDQRAEMMMRLKHPDIPASDYWPLAQIGQAMPGGSDE